MWLVLSTLGTPMCRRLASVALALVAALTIGQGLAGAQNDRRRELQDQIGEASRAEATALVELQAIRDAKATIDARVADLDRQVADAQVRLAPLEAEASRLTAQFEELREEVARTQAKVDAAQDEFDVSAASLYRSARRGASYDVVLAARPTRLVEQNKYLDQVSERRRQVVRRVTELRDELDQQRRAIESQKSKADAAAAEAQAARDQIARLRAEIEPARAEAANSESAEEQALASIRANKADYEGELAALQAASDSIAARLRAIGATPGQGGACQARPVPGGVSSPFGPRFHPILHYTRMHNGADMSAGSGTPIRACRGGTVVIAGGQGGYGNTVVIDHGGAMATLYAHQSRVAVGVGQSVGAGDVIGYVGSTGLSTGPHLHFEVRISGNPVDPGSYL
jgi:murein DD-endopeptidase MepM/ murein hydrolase activator NlpD